MPTINDWINVADPVPYDFATSWELRATLALSALLSLVAFYQIGFSVLHSSAIMSKGNGTAWAAASAIIWTWLLVWWGGHSPTNLEAHEALYVAILGPLAFPLFSILALFSVIGRLTKRETLKIVDFADFMAFLSAIPSFGLSPAVGYYASLLLLRFLSWPSLELFWSTVIVIGAVLAYIGARRQRAASNPLRGILGVQATGPSSGRSIHERVQTVIRSTGLAAPPLPSE